MCLVHKMKGESITDLIKKAAAAISVQNPLEGDIYYVAYTDEEAGLIRYLKFVSVNRRWKFVQE